MKALCGTLLGVMLVLMVAPLAAGPPSWDTQIKGQGRFKVLSHFNNEAVLDKETGLVWEQSPETDLQTWLDAQSHCNTKNVGGRMGWRLSTLQELASLVDQEQSSPALPNGHPFSIVVTTLYWSATTDANDTSAAWGVVFNNTGVVARADKSDVNNKKHVWCVRGGQGVDPQ